MKIQPSKLYWNWVCSEAALIESDGCSGVSGAMVECCWQHDLDFYHGRDTIDAYRLWRSGDPDYWLKARPIAFKAANRRFKECHEQRTKLGNFWWLNPMAWIRWRGVERLSKGAWERHRAKRPVSV